MFRTPLALSLALGLAAAPALADELNVYSYRQPELISPLTKAFAAETGIKVNVAFLKQGMVERLKAEGDRSPADVVLTVDISRLNELVEAGLTQPLKTKTLTDHIPATLHDPEGNWWGVTTRARIVYASNERVAPGEVTTYEDLANPKWKGRICTRSGTHPYNVALTAAILHHHDEAYTRKWLEGVKANLARRPEGNDRSQIKAIWAGQCDISLGNTYYYGQMLSDPEQIEWAESARPVFPVFEDGGTHINISGVALARYAPNKDNAIRFIEFLASSEAQEIYAEVNHEYPVAPGTEPAEMVKSWGSFTADDVNLIDIARLRPTALKLIEEVDFDG